ncbi:MAG: glucose-6-phosphate isomerase family protein [Anaerolineae bacterium]
MIETNQPFSQIVDLASGRIAEASTVTYRRLSDMRGWFADADAEAALIAENPLIYEVHYGYNAPSIDGQLGFGTTLLYPGRIGDEYYMTKGHYHRKADRAEIYYGLRGEGELLLQTRDGATTVQHMTPGVVAYIPAYHAHRTINTGSETFVFLSVYPADAGNDYESIAELGFAALLVERDGKPQVVPSPRYHMQA